MSRVYKKHYAGEVISNGAVLVKRVTPQKWEIKCACGNTFVSQVAGSTGRCGECGRKACGIANTKHGESPSSNKEASRLYRIWLGMLTRCNNPRNHGYKGYGDRGIRVCEEWATNYLSFKEWALANGYSDTLSINRIDNDKGYSPDNCNWATNIEQGRNRRNNHIIEFRGETMTMAEAAERFNIPYHTLKGRLNRYGYSVEEALLTPIGGKRIGNIR